MMKIKLAKSRMENEEGINHLWIEIPSFVFEAAEQLQFHISLPKGVFRLNNLNGYHEDKNGTILIDDFSKNQALIIEIFTQEPVPFSKGTICVELNYKDNLNQEKKINNCIPLSFVSDDEMDLLVIDEEVTNRVKQLRNRCIDDEKSQETHFVIVPPNIHNVSNHLSELEKKYRVDYGVNSSMIWR